MTDKAFRKQHNIMSFCEVRMFLEGNIDNLPMTYLRQCCENSYTEKIIVLMLKHLARKSIKIIAIQSKHKVYDCKVVFLRQNFRIFFFH